jgi:hypothetical protein
MWSGTICWEWDNFSGRGTNYVKWDNLLGVGLFSERGTNYVKWDNLLGVGQFTSKRD